MKVKVSRGQRKAYSKMSARLKKNVESSVIEATEELKRQIEAKTPVDTGLLKSSYIIEYRNMGGTYTSIISNKQYYLTYLIHGTGIYTPGGRQGGWVYKDSKGDYHFTYGMRPNDFITPTVNSYRDTLRKHIRVAIEDTFRGE